MGEENIRPKSIAREMFESYLSFAEYILEYDLERVEGLLLRHLNSVYKVLSQTVPDGAKTDDIFEMEWYLRTLLRQVDSSLADEWERMRDPGYQPFARAASRGAELRPPGAEALEADVTRDAKTFTAAIRARVFTFLRAWSTGEASSALAALDALQDEEGEAWTADRLKQTFEGFRAEHQRLRLDPEARNVRHTHVEPTSDGRSWRVKQMLVDPEVENDWVAEFDVDLEESRAAGQPILRLRRLGVLA